MIYRLTFAVLLLPLLIMAQDVNEEAIEAQYRENIQLDYINDVYIPVDIEDAMRQIDLLSNEEGRKKLIEADEQLAADRLVLGLGKWMIVNWNFYEGSRLSHAIKKYHVTHPDDMAKFLIVSYHRYLRNTPLELEKRGQIFFDKRKAEQEKRNAEKKIISG